MVDTRVARYVWVQDGSGVSVSVDEVYSDVRDVERDDGASQVDVLHVVVGRRYTGD